MTRLSYTPSRAEMHDIVSSLRAEGATYREIAALLGCARSTVSAIICDPDGAKQRARREKYRGECLDCGAPTDGSDGPGKARKHCRVCAPRHTFGKWSCEAIVDAIQRWNGLYGHPPSARDWNPSVALSGFRDDLAERYYAGDWPASSGVLKYFGSWNAAIEAAGFEPLAAGHKYVDAVSV